MATTATPSTTKFPVLLLAMSIVLLATGTGMGTGTAVDGKGLDGGCIRRVGETETPVPGSCLCYEKCASGRGDKPWLRDEKAQTCFVDCVLRVSGWVFCPAGEVPVAPSSPAPLPPPPPPPPPPVPVQDVVLTERVRLIVSRPKQVFRNRKEKEEMEEVLVIEIIAEPDFWGSLGLIVHLNSPQGGEEESRLYDHANPRYVATISDAYFEDEIGKRPGVNVHKYPIGGKLKTIGADGDERIVVSIVPVVFESHDRRPYWYEENKFIIHSVRIIYEPKQLYLDWSLGERD